MAELNTLSKPMVSVIIPVYKVKPYIEEALNSVINQTYENLEIVIVDDGSTDGSGEICDVFAEKDKRITVIHRENGGLSAARNTGLDNITGDYVAFLDSDDVFFPETIEKCVNAILTYDVECVVFKRAVCKTLKNGKLKRKSLEKIIPAIKEGVYSREEALNAVINKSLNAAVWNKFYKRSVWDNLRFSQGLVYEDLDIILPILYQTKKIYVLDEILILYRLRPDSISNEISLKNTEDFFTAHYNLLNFIKMHSPETFTPEQTNIIEKRILEKLIKRYAKTLSAKTKEKQEITAFMNGKIKNIEKEISIKRCNPEIRLTYFLIFNFPFILTTFYSLYIFVRKFIVRFITK